MKAAKIIPLVALLAAALWTVPVYAHTLFSEKVEPGVIRFFFGDGTYMVGGHVTVFDSSGAVIATGLTDEQGLFDFSAYEDAASVSAQDFAGHQRVHRLAGVENVAISTTDRAVIGVPIVIFLSSLAYHISVRKTIKNKRKGVKQSLEH